MKLTSELKSKIDSLDYESLLYKLRFAPMGDPMFQGEVGEYYIKRMSELKEQIGHEKAVEASKSIGWE